MRAEAWGSLIPHALYTSDGCPEYVQKTLLHRREPHKLILQKIGQRLEYVHPPVQAEALPLLQQIPNVQEFS